MSEPVKARSYNSPHRREQAATTRRSVLAAAGRQFEASGYAATTVAAIAADAGVSVKTVYLAFETKAGVLRALWNERLRGDSDDIPVADRDWYRAVLEEPDPARKLLLNARNSRAGKIRLGNVLEVVRSGADVDPEIAALWARIQSEFHANQRAIVEGIAAKNALAPGLTVDRATDILWTLNHPTVWLLLSRERGWTAEEYEEWFGDTACTLLLGSRPGA
ncbi:MAG TPA: TetR/AcrR family transcriptional regulator [Baekduia sp.]|nr:TetR/AcrR family transcriptional regulator [Baekduia sp.]